MSDQLHRMIHEQHAIVDGMVFPNGAVSASPWSHYQAHWLRDGLYTLEAYKHLGIHRRVVGLLNAPMNIFHRYQEKILYGVQRRPNKNYKFIHARYSAYTLEELTGDWGHNQLDVLGLFLHEVADLALKFRNLFHELDIRRLPSTMVVNNITRYLNSMKWWELPDYGVWEEGPDLHASSLGAVVGGLTKLEALNKKLKSAEMFFEREQLDKGRAALKQLLPRESKSESEDPNRNRECDLAQLSLIWPFEVLDREDEDAVLARIEKNLVREKGVARYACDPYYNSADDRMQSCRLKTGHEALHYRTEDTDHFPATKPGTEAEWPLGFAWLSIVYSHLAETRIDDERVHDYRVKAEHYWERLLDSAVRVEGLETGHIPELYSDGKPNVNTPLTWASAFAVVASVKLASQVA